MVQGSKGVKTEQCVWLRGQTHLVACHCAQTTVPRVEMSSNSRLMGRTELWFLKDYRYTLALLIDMAATHSCVLSAPLTADIH